MTDEPDAYMIDGTIYRNLLGVLKRLYAERPLTADERRDLANIMHANLHRAVPIPDEIK